MIALKWRLLIDGAAQTELEVESGGLFEGLPSLARNGGGGGGRCCRDESHLFNLHGWWHRPHIPRRGEEERGGLSSLPGRKHAGHESPSNLLVSGVVLATRRSFDEC